MRDGPTENILVVAAAAALIAGCSSARPLMPTPAIYEQAGGIEAFTAVHEEWETTDITLLYITDRGPPTEEQAEKGSPYGESRSRSIGFGTAVVDLVPDLDWPSLQQQSQLAERTVEINMELGAVDELGRFPEEPYEIQVTAAGVIRDPAIVAEHDKTTVQFQELLKQKLRKSPTKEVVLYIHGFNQTFDSAAFTMADLCHFLGREHVCAFFTWPASASGNFLTSYLTTIESAEFAVGHLHKTVRMIAQTDGVKGIQLLAHSRGAAVLLGAIRELFSEAITYGVEPAESLKIDNIVLMAPDVDLDVAVQKLTVFASDPSMLTHWEPELAPKGLRGRFTVYSNPSDSALGVSSFLLRSRGRVGQAELKDQRKRTHDLLEKWGKFDFIVYEGKTTDTFGHTYFVSNPQVSSDLIELVRYGKKPGEPGRPLKALTPVIWTFPEPGETTPP
jgi:esterase/lipase superfamily enzyme